MTYIKSSLISLGLSDLQAKSYLYLLESGEVSPPTLAKHLGMTRTNAYKVLESLENIDLVSRDTSTKKYTFVANDPSTLSTLVARKRNELIALENLTKLTMQELNKRLEKIPKTVSKISIHSGQKFMLKAYRSQSKTGDDIYFIKSRYDIPFLGFDNMQEIRSLVSGTRVKRFGITSDSPEAPINPDIDMRTNLTRTWMPAEAYTAPVEWSVSGSKLIIQIFDGNGHVIELHDKQVADSFLQLWCALDSQLRNNPGYNLMPRRAERRI